MARLPQPGGDSGNWGDILNDFLNQAHRPDGQLKQQSITNEMLGLHSVEVTTLGPTAGADGQVLVRDSNAQTGLAWRTPDAIPDVEYPVTSVAGKTGDITLSRADVGLANVDNTADVNKPVSAATQAALDDKVSSTLGGQESVVINNTATGSVTLSLASGNIFSLRLTGNITGLTITDAMSGRGCSFSLYITQDTIGGRTISWPSSVKWPGGSIPTLSTAPGAVDILVFESINGGATWFGALAGKGYA